MREEYEGIARRALQDAESAMKVSNSTDIFAESYRKQALTYCEIATAAAALLAALNTKEEVG